MLKNKVVHVFCGPRENSWQSAKKTVGMSNEEERNSRSLG